MIPLGLAHLWTLVHLARPREPFFATKGVKSLCSPKKQLFFGLSWSSLADLLFTSNSQPCTASRLVLAWFLYRIPCCLETV